MIDLNFGAPHWLWALAAIPILIVLFVSAERRGALRLQQFVSGRLLAELSGTVNRFRRALRFALLLLGLALAVISLARPQRGYVYQELKRKGLDLLVAVDTSRSMLSNDVEPSRLERMKLAAQDLISEMQGDRVGLIAFAGRAFLQAPLTIDYDAEVEAINDLDTNTIPEGGTNISDAINLARQTFGKSATGNRALIICTDGEELSGDAVATAKAAAEAGIRIFTIGVGTPEGSLIPIAGEAGGTAFVKDEKGQVVKSKLDEKRLREIAEATGGFYLHLENGPDTMQKLFADGLGKMQAGDINARMSRTPIERYQWPLGAAIIFLTASLLVRERKRVSARPLVRSKTTAATLTTGALALIFCSSLLADVAGLDLYREGKYPEAYKSFQDDLRQHPDSPERPKMEFDSGAAAFKMKDYNKALDSFSQALLSPDKKLQEDTHFNLGRTLEERADMDQENADTLRDLGDAAAQYEDALRIDPSNAAAKANLAAVKEKIERLKKKPKQKPTPPPQAQNQQKQKQQDQQQSGGGGSDQDQQQQKSSGKDQNKQQQQQSEENQDQKNQSGDNDKNEKQPQQNKNEQQNKAGASPLPSASASASPSENQKQQNGGESPTPSPSAGENQKQNQDQRGEGQETPTPSPGESGENQNAGSPSPAASGSPGKKLTGDVQGAPQDQSPPPKTADNAQTVEAEPEKEGEMSEKQAQALLRSMKDEERRVLLDERKAARHVYKDW